ncbi:MAG: hypothetical protein LBD02_07895 [Christensenellaceae bacterium]|nr:hypothetical protein [Christensenellaceae bacterium]
MSVETSWNNESGHEGYQYIFRVKAQTESAPQEIGFEAQIIRSNGGIGDAEYPIVTVIPSRAALERYFDENSAFYDLAPRETVYADTSIGFDDAMERYDEAFFAKSYLVLAVLEEGSGSIRHRVKAVAESGEITIERLLPEFGTDDMAQWHLIIELEKGFEPGGFSLTFEDVQAG